MEECVVKTLREMLQQRGYQVFYDEESNMAGRKGRTSTIVVFFNLAPKVNNDRIQEYITKMKNLNYTHAIVVYQLSVTPPAEKVLQELQGLRIEMFQSRTLRYNITEHRLVPKHTLLSKSEIKTFKDEFGTKIPILSYNDSIARFYDFQKGDIIKIERPNGFVCYRIVK
jgi:DNA-directed RNA polymerase I, II, and III subunit RPABC1